MRRHSTDPAAIEAEIAHLRSLALDALQRRWRVIFGRTPPAALSRDVLGRMIAERRPEGYAATFRPNKVQQQFQSKLTGDGLAAIQDRTLSDGAPLRCASSFSTTERLATGDSIKTHFLFVEHSGTSQHKIRSLLWPTGALCVA
jgi:hypothetical protein